MIIKEGKFWVVYGNSFDIITKNPKILGIYSTKEGAKKRAKQLNQMKFMRIKPKINRG